MASVSESSEIGRIIRDTFERGDAGLALWLAAQHAAELRHVATAPSLVGPPVFFPASGFSFLGYGALVRADDRAALRSAIAAAGVMPSVIYFPPGVYELRRSARSPAEDVWFRFRKARRPR